MKKIWILDTFYPHYKIGQWIAADIFSYFYVNISRWQYFFNDKNTKILNVKLCNTGKTNR